MNNTARPGWVAPASGPPGWAKALAYLAGGGVAFWATWCTVIILIGGTLPLVGAQTDGNVLAFLLMLFIGEPVLVTLAYWSVKLILLPVTHAATRGTDR